MGQLETLINAADNQRAATIDDDRLIKALKNAIIMLIGRVSKKEWRIEELKVQLAQEEKKLAEKAAELEKHLKTDTAIKLQTL